MIHMSTAIMLIILGYLVKYKQWSWLIAGYNTSSKKEKAKDEICYISSFKCILYGFCTSKAIDLLTTCRGIAYGAYSKGAIDRNNNWWKSVEYIPYPFLKKASEKVLLDIIEKHSNCYKVRQLINTMYKKYPKGFYVNAKRRLNNIRQAIKYIGRYGICNSQRKH